MLKIFDDLSADANKYDQKNIITIFHLYATIKLQTYSTNEQTVVPVAMMSLLYGHQTIDRTAHECAKIVMMGSTTEK